MFWAVLADLVVVISLVGYLLYGLTLGLTRSLIVVAGMLCGLVLAFTFALNVQDSIPGPELRAISIIAFTVVVAAISHVITHLVAKKIRFSEVSNKLQVLDRVAGGVGLSMFFAIVVATTSLIIGTFGVPGYAKAVSGAVTIQTIDDATPREAREALFGLLYVFSNESPPLVPDNFGSRNLPDVAFISKEGTVKANQSLSQAARSVVRITGSAYACGQGRSGTGFVIAEDRIVTNAHILAGVTRPVIEAPNGQILTGKVVYFDSQNDVAIIAVTGLDVSALSSGIGLQTGESATTLGYANQGSLTASPAQVVSINVINALDIYRERGSARAIYILDGKFAPGDSGGPVLNVDGNYIGMVYARDTKQTRLGYAMTLTSFRPAVKVAAMFTELVSSGPCIID
jgi:S1-C subfamily serine protease